MKKHWLLVVIALAVAVYQGWQPPTEFTQVESTGASSAQPSPQPAQSASLDRAIADRDSHVQIEGRGSVLKLLADDQNGSRHQRFLVRLDSGAVILIAHNIDLAPRIDSLRSDDAIEFAGEYIWNDKGGLVHWTHHDPAGRHVGGWLQHDGRRYQ